MYSHVTVGYDDFARARAFYDAIMSALGHPVLFAFDEPGIVACGEATGPKRFVLPPFDGGEERPANGMHAAFLADTRAMVDAFHTATLANGDSDEGAPGLRPHDHPSDYGAYVRDPDGNELQAVCHRKEG
jgi:catechol 2,3-dioxygenase-like lactoylglutathione lyase family enzyme